MADDRRLGSLGQLPDLDRWVALAAPGRVEVRTGKVELGQGILTALTAIAADELGVDPVRIDVVSGITGTTPNEWITAGSGSVEQSGMAVRQVIDPDGLTNQLEGGFVQAASWTLKEQVDADRPGDWEAYPILRFSETPELATRLLDHPDRRVLGAGEASTGPTAAAIANAVFQATGARLRDLPLRPATVLSGLTALL